MTERSISPADTLAPRDRTLPSACIAAGAVLHARDGLNVIAHYGSVPGELAVCLKTVGLIDHSDYGVHELRGDRTLLDRALTHRLGDPPLPIGEARRIAGVWHLRLHARLALLVGPHGALMHPPAAGRRNDPPPHDITTTLAILGIVGPRAPRLLTAAGLPGLQIGAITDPYPDTGIIAILRESQRRYLALIHDHHANSFWSHILTAGKPLGAACVGHDALTLLNATEDRAG